MVAASQLFFSGEKVFEEATFGKFSTDVITMFTWTLWTQVTLGWVLYPLQGIEAFGGAC
jgi:hypothetical protein